VTFCLKKDDDLLTGRTSVFGLDEEVRGVYGAHIKPLIGRADLGVGIIDMGLGVKKLRFWHSGRGSGLDIPKTEVLEDLFYDVLALDEGNDVHRPLASFDRLRTGLGHVRGSIS
jgi:hypothetical protein